MYEERPSADSKSSICSVTAPTLMKTNKDRSSNDAERVVITLMTKIANKPAKFVG